MSETVHFPRLDGDPSPGHFVPAEGPGAAGIVVIQEWWGINDQMKSVADRVAKLGYHALVPDLYRGRQASTADEANHMMGELDWPDATHQDLPGAVQFLKQRCDRVAVLGFCMGGALTIAAGVHVPDLTAGVCFYGIPPKELADPAEIDIPMLFHFATRDDWCTPEAVSALEKTLLDAGVDHTLHRYEADHAFFNEARPEVYDATASGLAWERTRAFLAARLG